MKKKLVTIMVAVSMMAMCLTACSKDEETSKKEKKTTVVDSKKEDKDEKKASEKEDKKESKKEEENKDWSKAYDDYFERVDILDSDMEIKTVASGYGVEYEVTYAKAGDMKRMSFQYSNAVFDMYADSEKVYAYYDAGGESQWLWCPANEEEVSDLTEVANGMLITEDMVSWTYREEVTEDGIVYDVLDVVTVDEEVSTVFYINRETQKIAKCIMQDSEVSAVSVINESKSIKLPSDADTAVESSISDISLYLLGVMMRGIGVPEE